jgi:hypothetical protein
VLPRRGIAAGAALLLGAVAFVTALTLALIRLVVARPAQRSELTTAPLGPPLTRHLVFVIIDGLRHDLAVDPEAMPALSQRMARESHAEIWAGPVSMTSSAVLTYGSGQRGDLEQIVNNETGAAVAYDDVIGNAREAGLITAGIGDRAWFRMFPRAWDLVHPDPDGVAIDVDYNAEIFGAAYDFAGRTPRPNLLVVHFVTPDHQAHAYGTFSARYRAHLRGFDADLDAFLRSLPPDTTVIVTSDHGATDTGTHGSDTPVQRRSPLAAWGPGIVAGRAESRRLDQVDLPGTFAALLGVAPPVDGRGHVLVDWLDVDDERRAAMACANLARLRSHAQARADSDAVAATGAAEACAPERDARARIASAEASAAALDAVLGRAHGPGFAWTWLAPLFAVAGGGALAAAALGSLVTRHARRFAGAALLMAALAALALFVLVNVERMPGWWPNAARIALWVTANAALLWALLRPRTATAWLDARPALGAVVLPGLLLVTDTKSTQIESLVLSLVLAGVAMTIGIDPRDGGLDAIGHRGGSLSARRDDAEARRLWLSPAAWRLPWRRVALALAIALPMVPVGILNNGFAPALLGNDTWGRRAAALLALLVLVVHRFDEERRAGRSEATGRALAFAGIALAMASLWARTRAPAPVCLGIWLGAPLLAVLAWRGRRRVLAELFLVVSYAQVARDDELPVLVASYLFARITGEALRAATTEGAPPAQGEKPPRASLVLVAVTFLFAWTFLQRIGIQRGLDFMYLDWGAGAFREPGVSMLRIGAAIAWKHELARAAVLFAVLSALPGAHRVLVARGLLAAEAVRAAVLAVVLYAGRDSFWTGMRAIGDTPHALASVVVAAGALLVVESLARASAGARPASATTAAGASPAPGKAGGATGSPEVAAGGVHLT